MATAKKKKPAQKAIKKPVNTKLKVAHKPAPKPKPEKAQKEAAISKKAQITTLMERPEGVTIEEMMKLTDWQGHTVRGFLSMQKKAGKNVISERINDERRYRIEATPAKAEEAST